MPEPESSARHYARIRYRLLITDFAVSLVVLGAMQATGLSRALAHWSERLTSHQALVVLLYLAVFGAGY